MASVVNLVLVGIVALKAVYANPVADPMVTPEPFLRRQDGGQFIGWYASSVIGTSTSWGYESCKAGYTVTTAGNYYKCCSTAAACNMFTSCSGNWIVGPGTSTPCSAIATGMFCSYDLLYPSLGALQAQSYVWCGSVGDSGTNLYRYTTGSATLFPTSTTPTSTTPAIVAATTPPVTTSPSPVPKHTSVGAIVGGVIGGVAVLAVLVGAIVYFCLRKRHTSDPYSQAGSGVAEYAAAPVLTPEKNTSVTVSPSMSPHPYGMGSQQYNVTPSSVSPSFIYPPSQGGVPVQPQVYGSVPSTAYTRGTAELANAHERPPPQYGFAPQSH